MADIASIILSTLDARRGAFDRLSRARQESYGRVSQAVGELGETIGEIPSMVKAHRAEREGKGFNDTVTSALMENGDPKNTCDVFNPFAPARTAR